MGLFTLIKNAGTTRIQGYNLIRKVKLTNVIAFIASGVSVLNTLGFLFNGGKAVTVLNTFAIAVFLFIPILWNRFGHHIISRNWFLTFLAYTVLSSAFFAGGNYLAEYIFIPCVGIPFLIFSNKELYVSIIWSGVYFGLFFFQKYLYTVVTPLDPISLEEGALMTKYLTALLFFGVIGIYVALSIESRVKESFIKESYNKEKGLKEVAEANFAKLIESQKDLIQKERERIHAQKSEINALKEAESRIKLIEKTHKNLNSPISLMKFNLELLEDDYSSSTEEKLSNLKNAYTDVRESLEDFFKEFNLTFYQDSFVNGGDENDRSGQFGLNVLLVDDMDINRSLAKAMLTNFGCDVVEANGGNAAIEIYKEGRFDLVLMDINMPDKNGDETVKEIKEKYKADSVFIGLSANALEGDLKQYKEMGLDDYVSKPLTFQKLFQVLKQWFEVKGGVQNQKTEVNIEKSFLYSETIIRKNADMVGGPKKFIKFIDKFLKENNAIWTELYSDFAVKGVDKLKDNLHKLSGISASMGAGGYSELLNEAYKTLKENKEISKEEFDVLNFACEEVSVAFKEIKNRWQERES